MSSPPVIHTAGMQSDKVQILGAPLQDALVRENSQWVRKLLVEEVPQWLDLVL